MITRAGIRLMLGLKGALMSFDEENAKAPDRHPDDCTCQVCVFVRSMRALVDDAFREEVDDDGPGGESDPDYPPHREHFGQPAAPKRAEPCGMCKRERCDCYARDFLKCHWPGSPNCRGKSK